MFKKFFTIICFSTCCSIYLFATHDNTLFRITNDKRIKTEWIKTSDDTSGSFDLIQVDTIDRYNEEKGYG